MTKKKEEEDENPLAMIMDSQIEKSGSDESAVSNEIGYVPISTHVKVVRDNVRMAQELAHVNSALAGLRKAGQKQRDLTEEAISEKTATDKVIWEDESQLVTRIKQMGLIFVLFAGGFLFYQYQNSPVFHEQVGKFLSNQFNVAIVVILIIVCLYLYLKYGRKKA